MRSWRRELEARLSASPLDAARKAEIVEEVSQHLDDRYDELMASGLSSDDAARRALAEIDDLAALQRRREPAPGRPARTPRRTARAVIDELLQAVPQALRQFRHQKLYALATVATLALAVAASTASVAVLKRAFLDPLPYANGDELVSLLTVVEGRVSPVSTHVLDDLRRETSPFSHFAAVSPRVATFTSENGSEPAVTNQTTPAYFDTLGVQPALGGAWRDGDPRAAVVSWAFWQRALGGDPAVVGRSIVLDGTQRVVTGVMPERFVPPYWHLTDAWTPLDAAFLAREPRARRQLTVIARAPGEAIADVDAYLEAFTARMRAAHPTVHGAQTWRAERLRDELVGPVRPALVGTGAAAALLLLIVCANIAGLTAARAVSLRQQTAIRLALGASRGRLLRQRLVDGLVLAAAGTGAGLALALAVVAVIARAQAQFLARMEPVALDAGTALAGAVAGLVTGVVAVLVPHSAMTSRRIADALRGTRGTAGDASGTRLRSSLVVLQVALALVLIVGAGLLARTVRHLATTAIGFETAPLTLTQLNLPGSRYASAAQQIQFERDVIEQLRRVPGVEDAAAGVGFPIIGGMMAGLTIQGALPDQAPVEIAYMSVSPNLFGMLGVPTTAGRGFADTDTAATPGVFLINEMMARTYWPQGNALGARVYIGPGGPADDSEWATVIGIVPDLRQHGPTEPVRPTAYGSTLQFSWPRRHLAVRSDTMRPSLAADIRTAIRAVDPGLALGPIQPVDAQVAMRTARHELAMGVLTFFGFVALVLCGFGLYAVVAMTSQLRRREYAIRMALGAPRAGVRWMVVRQALTLAAGGAVAGLAAAALSTRALQGMLHGVEAVDAATFAAASVIVLAIAGMSAWFPARRAGRVDPVEALQAD